MGQSTWNAAVTVSISFTLSAPSESWSAGWSASGCRSKSKDNAVVRPDPRINSNPNSPKGSLSRSAKDAGPSGSKAPAFISSGDPKGKKPKLLTQHLTPSVDLFSKELRSDGALCGTFAVGEKLARLKIDAENRLTFSSGDYTLSTIPKR
jgi:hypothetical protein